MTDSQKVPQPFLTCHSECSEESPAKRETLHCAQGDMIGVAGLSTHTVRSRRQGRLRHISDFLHLGPS